jgi:hypothetical protein
MPLRARDIADICDDLAIERASVTVKEGWDYNEGQIFLTFGPPGYKQTMVIDPNWGIDDVKAKLEAAKAPEQIIASMREPVMVAAQVGNTKAQEGQEHMKIHGRLEPKYESLPDAMREATRAALDIGQEPRKWDEPKVETKNRIKAKIDKAVGLPAQKRKKANARP